MTSKTKQRSNPDVVVLENGALQLTLTIDKINVQYSEGVTIEGKEATYEARRRAHYDTPHASYMLEDASRTTFTVPLEHAAGYAIGSTVIVTIAKAVGR